jgi:hypothetical protein
MQVKVKTGKGMIRGHYGETTVEKTLPIAANASGNPRIDRVVLRGDFVNNRIEVDIIQGTPPVRRRRRRSRRTRQHLGTVARPGRGRERCGDDHRSERDRRTRRDLAVRDAQRALPVVHADVHGNGAAPRSRLGTARCRAGGGATAARSSAARSSSMGSTSVAPNRVTVVSLPVNASAQVLHERDPCTGD